jgi:hypothetical protein
VRKDRGIEKEKKTSPGIFPDKKTVEHFFGLPKPLSKEEARVDRDDEYTVSFKGIFETTVKARSESEALRKATEEEDWVRTGRISQRDLEVV